MAHFLGNHAEELRARGSTARFLLLDRDLHASRSGFIDLPRIFFQVLVHLLLFRPDVLITITPKAGFISALTRFMSRKTKRIHWFTGQVWCLDRGLRFHIKRLPDLVIARLIPRILCDSHPQREFLLKNGFDFAVEKIRVIGYGSICGVNDNFFDSPPSRQNPRQRFGVVGRINRDKGIGWLIEHSSRIFSTLPDIEIIFHGSIDEEEFVDEFDDFVASNSNVTMLGECSDQFAIYSSFDVLLCLSFREGFSNVLIEAQAFGIPVITRDIYAVSSSYQRGITGFSFVSVEELLLHMGHFTRKGPHNDIGELCQDFVRHRFKRSAVLNQVSSYYEGVAIGSI